MRSAQRPALADTTNTLPQANPAGTKKRNSSKVTKEKKVQPAKKLTKRKRDDNDNGKEPKPAPRSELQEFHLLEFMKTHNLFCAGTFLGVAGNSENHKLWDRLRRELNELGGPSRRCRMDSCIIPKNIVILSYSVIYAPSLITIVCFRCGSRCRKKQELLLAKRKTPSAKLAMTVSSKR